MILRVSLILTIFTIYFEIFATAFRQQSVGIVGRLICGNQPLQDTEIKLWDKNAIGRDVQLAVVRSDFSGKFKISGGTTSLLKMDVHLKVYHNCENRFGLCKRKVDLEVPSTYVTRSSNVEKWFDAGTLNMAFKYPDESTECL